MSKIIRGYQLRAARAMLDWSIQDLSAQTGVGTSSLTEIEREQRTPQGRTMEKILLAFEQAGVQFTDDGVRIRRDKAYSIEGNDWFPRVLDLVEQQLKDVQASKKELLLMFTDDRLSPPEIVDKFRSLRANGIKMKQLVEAGNRYLLGQETEYRWVPQEEFRNVVTLIFGDFLVLDAKTEPPSGIVVHDSAVAEQARNQFFMLWKRLEKAEESSANADERF